MRTALMIIFFGIEALMLVGMWKTYAKAGMPAWGVFIPGYNLYLLIKAAGLPSRWIFYCLIPIANLIVIPLIEIKFCARFNKGFAYGLGLFFLPFILFPVLGFSDARYEPLPQRI